MEQPLVSVVIPFYSGANWLIEAIDSVLNQTYKNIEVLVINDGSPENIDMVKKKYESDVQIIDKKNGGPASARNLGIEKASGKYVAFLDSDDIWLPDKLSKQIFEMEKHNYIWSQHSYEMFWNDSKKTKIVNTSAYSGDIYMDCFISLKIQTSCVVVQRKFLMENEIRFPIEKRYGQDGAFYKQIAKITSIGYIDGVYSKFRIRGTNAGFRAKVQIYDRASTWKEIKEDNDLLEKLPKPIICAYRALGFFSKLIDKPNIKNEMINESMSRFMYIFPYMIFKIYAKNVK